jgi:hypothetical protein
MERSITMPDCLHDLYDYKEVGTHLGRYCATCGKWIKWVTHVKNDDFIIPYGKHKGKKLKDLPKDYLEWLLKNSKKTIYDRVKKILS